MLGTADPGANVSQAGPAKPDLSACIQGAEAAGATKAPRPQGAGAAMVTMALEQRSAGLAEPKNEQKGIRRAIAQRRVRSSGLL